MDEPTAALSSSEVEMLYTIIRELKSHGVSIIYISHKLDEVFTVADMISVLRDGNLVASGPIGDYDQKKIINLMVGRELRFVPAHNEKGASGKELFSVEGLTNEPHFRNISFSVNEHEILGITGLVGAGRSELAQTVFGLMPPSAGTIKIHGDKVSINNSNDAITKGICYLPEDRRTQGLFQGNSMAKNITTVTLKKVLNRFRLISRAKELGVAQDYIEKISIRPNLPEIHVENLSGGNQQKTMISRWLQADPKVLIADEPTSGVDVGAKLEIHKLLRMLADDGVCVILISSDLPEVLAVSDRILVMREGNVVDEVMSSEASQEGILEKGLIG
jgi:ABC-type sugar transport system ATPase subunit